MEQLFSLQQLGINMYYIFCSYTVALLFFYSANAKKKINADVYFDPDCNKESPSTQLGFFIVRMKVRVNARGSNTCKRVLTLLASGHLRCQHTENKSM